MYGYRNTVRLCLLEYFIVMLAHMVYAFVNFGAEEGIYVLIITAVMISITFLFTIIVKKEDIVITVVFLSVVVASALIGCSLHTLGYTVLMYLCMTAGLTIFMDKKHVINAMIISSVAFIIYGVFFTEELLLSVSSIFMYVVYCFCYLVSSINLYIIVKYATQYMNGMKEKAEEAERANSSKMLFLANMSHEIRTPMNAICGMSELNLHEELSPQVRENTESIQASGKILLSIVNDILDYSKMESGKMEIVPVTYSLSHLINETARMMEIRLTDKQVDLKVKIDSSIPDALIGDEVRIRQILYNIITNAIKFTDTGYILIDVTGDVIDEDNLRLYVTVTDTGIGIRKEDLGKLFTSFQQLDTHKSHAREGTGLGLAISKELCTLMNGSINVESTYGVGSKFSFNILQRISKKSDKLIFSETTTESTETTIQAPEAKVLVVDDNAVNLKVAEGLLSKSFGIKVETCKGGRECLDILNYKKDFDIIFLDHMMPELDGIETLKQIRNYDDEYMKTVPVVALTANVMSGVREMFINEGFDDYVPKPIDINWVNSVLRKYLPTEKQR